MQAIVYYNQLSGSLSIQTDIQKDLAFQPHNFISSLKSFIDSW